MSVVLMAGDVNLVNVTDPSVPLARVGDVMRSADAVFCNLESTLYEPMLERSVGDEGFYVDPGVGVEVIRRGNISGVGLANNVNYGREAILASVTALDEQRIPHSGAGADLITACRPAVIESGGRRYGFFQRSSVFWPTDHVATEASPGIAVLPGHTAYEVPSPVNRPGIPPIILTWADRGHLDSFLADIRQLRTEVETLIVSCHWGLLGGVLTYMDQIAHAVIDAGADVVMGHGPHQPLPIGFYRDKPIFYGLGSFSFHTGHLGLTHGDWVGLLAELMIEDSTQVSFRFVRHNDRNETIFSDPAGEGEILALLAARSSPHGASLTLAEDRVTVAPA